MNEFSRFARREIVEKVSENTIFRRPLATTPSSGSDWSQQASIEAVAVAESG